MSNMHCQAEIISRKLVGIVITVHPLSSKLSEIIKNIYLITDFINRIRGINVCSGKIISVYTFTINHDEFLIYMTILQNDD